MNSRREISSRFTNKICLVTQMACCFQPIGKRYFNYWHLINSDKSVFSRSQSEREKWRKQWSPCRRSGFLSPSRAPRAQIPPSPFNACHGGYNRSDLYYTWVQMLLENGPLLHLGPVIADRTFITLGSKCYYRWDLYYTWVQMLLQMGPLLHSGLVITLVSSTPCLLLLSYIFNQHKILPLKVKNLKMGN